MRAWIVDRPRPASAVAAGCVFVAVTWLPSGDFLESVGPESSAAAGLCQALPLLLCGLAADQVRQRRVSAVTAGAVVAATSAIAILLLTGVSDAVGAFHASNAIAYAGFIGGGVGLAWAFALLLVRMT